MIKGFVHTIALLAGPIIIILMVAAVARGTEYPKNAENSEIKRHSRCMEIANVGAAAMSSRVRKVPIERIMLDFQEHDVGFRKAIRDAYNRSLPMGFTMNPVKGHAAYRQRVYKECQKGLY